MQTPTTLSLIAAQIEHYRRDEYLVVPDPQIWAALLQGEKLYRLYGVML